MHNARVVGSGKPPPKFQRKSWNINQSRSHYEGNAESCRNEAKGAVETPGRLRSPKYWTLADKGLSLEWSQTKTEALSPWGLQPMRSYRWGNASPLELRSLPSCAWIPDMELYAQRCFGLTLVQLFSILFSFLGREDLSCASVSLDSVRILFNFYSSSYLRVWLKSHKRHTYGLAKYAGIVNTLGKGWLHFWL